MTKIETIKYWLKAAEMDLPISEKLFNSKDYVWSLYIGHLVLEKSLKALLVSVNDITPPKTHNLVKLAQLTELNFEKIF